MNRIGPLRAFRIIAVAPARPAKRQPAGLRSSSEQTRFDPSLRHVFRTDAMPKPNDDRPPVRPPPLPPDFPDIKTRAPSCSRLRFRDARQCCGHDGCFRRTQNSRGARRGFTNELTRRSPMRSWIAARALATFGIAFRSARRISAATSAADCCDRATGGPC